MSVSIAEQIRSARIALGMSVKELADRAQISVSYLYAIESGERGSHIDKLYRVCKQLGLKLDDVCSQAYEGHII